MLNQLAGNGLNILIEITFFVLWVALLHKKAIGWPDAPPKFLNLPFIERIALRSPLYQNLFYTQFFS